MDKNARSCIGIIVTAFNVEKYIEECINSICRQTYDNWELIITDDGSTDSTGIICDRFASLDKRIKVIHQNNQGPIIAKFNAIKQIQSEYVVIIDGDDYVDSNYLASIIDNKYFKKVDIIIYSIKRLFPNGEVKLEDSGISDGIYDKNELMRLYGKGVFWDEASYGPLIDYSLCTKVFKKDCIKKQLKETIDLKIHYGEDLAVLFPILLYSNSFCFSSEAFYYHRRRLSGDIPGYIEDKQFFEKMFNLYVFLKNIFLKENVSNELIKQLDLFYMNSIQEYKQNYSVDANIEKYPFPYEKIYEKKKIVLYGAGKVGKSYYFQIKQNNNFYLVGWVDAKPKLMKKMGVTDVEEIAKMDFDFLVVAIDDSNVRKKVKSSLIARFSNCDNTNIII